MHTTLKLSENGLLRIEIAHLIGFALLTGDEKTGSERFSHFHIEHIVRESTAIES